MYISTHPQNIKKIKKKKKIKTQKNLIYNAVREREYKSSSRKKNSYKKILLSTL